MFRQRLRGRWRELGLATCILWLSLGGGSCDSTPQSRAFRVEDRAQLVGGPAAIGEIGDYIIENDQIRAVVLQGGNSVGPGMFGGTIVDADLRRPEQEHAGGRGLDQFSELFPMVNLVIPGYHDEGSAGVGDLDVQIWSDGTGDRCPLTDEEAPEGCAAIRVAGRGDYLLESLGTIELLGVSMDLSFVTYYTLRPGDTYVQLRTFFWIDGHGGWDYEAAGFNYDDEEADVLEDEPQRLMEIAAQTDDDSNFAALRGEQPIFDAILGDALDPTASPYRHAGLMAGDFLLFGKDVSAFGTSTLADGLEADRSGFDVSYLFQRRFDRGEIVLERPIADSVLVGVGDRVSYGYFSGEGSVVVPILTSSFTGTFTHAYQCVTDSSSETCGDELDRPFVYDRYFVIGRGDASSVLEVYYDMNDIETGRVTGHVFDEQTGQPLDHARVFALLDPRDHQDLLAAGYPGDETALEDYDDLAEQLRWLDLDGDGDRNQNPGIVTFASTDGGIDHLPDADFDMRLEPGNYFLVGVVSGHRTGRPIPVTVSAGGEVEISLPVPPAGRINYEIFNDRGAHATAKLTFIGPLADDAQCPIDQNDPSLISVLSELRHLELGASERPQQIAHVVYSQHGHGQVDLAPGRYDVIASRGFEYSIDRRCIDIRHDTAPVETFSILREVDTTGWVAGDFHVHGQNSFDGNMRHDARIISSVAEGVEVFSTTDHDYITNLEPLVYDLNYRDEVSTMVGIEITPLELGHILGYPLRFDETAVDNGAPDWTRRDHCLSFPDDFGCPENVTGYLGETPDEIFQMIRQLGEFGPEHTVVTVPHPRDGFFGYFDQYALNQFDLVLDEAGMVRGQNPMLTWFPTSADANMQFRLYSENFDAIELFNGARYEAIRTPTVREVTSFARDLGNAVSSATSDEEFARQMTVIHDRTVRDVLLRTAEEQAALRYDRFIECITHDDCEEAELCDPHRSQCVPDAYPPCDGDNPCPDGFNCEGNIVTGTDNARCIEACQSDLDCKIDEYCSQEGVGAGTCARAACNIDSSGMPLEGDGPESPDRPCVRNLTPHSEGVVDDWFRLLNYGVFYTGMGNSDTHTPHSEIGLPRNYVLSSTDAPVMIDRREIADNIREGRVVASYGPFIEVHAEDGSIGDTVSANGQVDLHVRVQSPSWFDVDRIEIYANGTLLCDIGYSPEPSSSPCNTDAEIAWEPSTGRNTNIVNFNGVIIDDPEIDTWYVVIAMGASPLSRGLSPVYFAGLHPNLGISEIIGQAFASFDNPMLSAVVPPPVARAEVNLMIPYAITNPIWIESANDDDERWIPPLGVGDPNDPESHGIPGYRRDIICQNVSSERSRNTAGCRDQPLMPLSTESLGTGDNPFVTPLETDIETNRWRRFLMIQRALMRLDGGGC